MKLTGRTRYRTSFRGKLILQVEETWASLKNLNGSGYYDEHVHVRWRDAKVTDMHLIQDEGGSLVAAA